MKKYLLDTNIWIYYLKGQFDLKSKFDQVGIENLGISEISIAELKFGAYNSNRIEANLKTIEALLQQTRIYPILPGLDIYAKEKVRLRTKGKPVDDFDLLIASTAIAFDITLVSRNIKHFDRIDNLQLEDWIL